MWRESPSPGVPLGEARGGVQYTLRVPVALLTVLEGHHTPRGGKHHG
jgi:hypothetical protein